jgi:Rrf2 family protein
MFKISRRLDYGMQVMITLAAGNEKRTFPTSFLAEKLSMPLPFLHQVAHSLMQSGLINASPGPKGGLRLNYSSEEITLQQIVEALEGPLDLNPCQQCDDDCSRKGGCPTRLIWSEMQDNINTYLKSKTLKSIIEEHPATLNLLK